MAESLPSRVGVVVIGGGVAGASVAYHLAQFGVKDVLLLERKQLACGTTWHAAGLIGQLRASENLTALAKYSSELYLRLPEETGVATGFTQNGSLNVAASQARMEELLRGAAMGRRFGLEVLRQSKEEIKQRVPHLHTDDLIGGVFLPADGQADPVGIVNALAAGAKANGARIMEGVKVKRIIADKGRAIGLSAIGKDGAEVDIAADKVVLCAGLWSRDLAAAAGACVPLYAAEHYYLVTEPVAGLGAMPVIRDADACAYYKEDAGKILLGCFEPEAIPYPMENIGEDFAFESLPGDFAHFEPILEKAMRRFPALADAGVKLFFCGPESFTPDDRYYLGESPHLMNLFVATGFNSIGIQSAGGVGRALAEWIRDGDSPGDLGDVDIRRISDFQKNRRYLKSRVTETLGLLYQIHWPHYQMKTARGVRRSVLHDKLKAAGACFGEAAGWERPNWFCQKGQVAEYQYAWGRQNWFANCARECRAASEGAALLDVSSFSKYLVTGADACAGLNRICANDINAPCGKIVYTQWLNARGGIEADVTVARLCADKFLIVSGAGLQARDLAHLRRHISSDARCAAVDVTSGYAAIAVIGPQARAVMEQASPDDFSEEGFCYASVREIEIGDALALALRLGYAGEAGWELFIPTEFAAAVYEEINRAAKAAGANGGGGIIPAGFHALDSLRMEKARRHFGHDITPEDTPLEAGLGFAVAWDKPGGFIGDEALRAARAQTRTKRLLVFAANDANAPLLHGEEPLWRNGECVGAIASGAYGHRVGASLGLGYVRASGEINKEWLAAGEWQIEVGEKFVPAAAALRAPYDPGNQKLRIT